MILVSHGSTGAASSIPSTGFSWNTQAKEPQQTKLVVSAVGLLHRLFLLHQFTPKVASSTRSFEVPDVKGFIDQKPGDYSADTHSRGRRWID